MKRRSDHKAPVSTLGVLAFTLAVGAVVSLVLLTVKFGEMVCKVIDARMP